MPRDHRPARSLRVLLNSADAAALAVQLTLRPDIEVVARVAPGEDPRPAAQAGRPEVALVEDLAAVAALAAELPDCRTVLLAGSARPGLAAAALAAGAAGLLLRDGPVEELAAALRRVSMGETVVDPALDPPEAAPAP
ncbi:DNA-binding response regulator [Streptomyces sp. NPDC097619]|uniref:DNA-binding response regulator n=1 Tax=Streptomyces sp. NPDC097619 TaxID=3157228 RepID=UPI0033323217